jgi:enoyl-CoA hydratase/carnithine racemase
VDLTDGRRGKDSADGFQVAVGDDGVAVLAIDRESKRNAVTWDMWAALPQILDKIAAEPGVRVLMVTGVGEHFSAGADLAELSEVYAEGTRARAYHATNVAAEAALAGFPRPTVAVIHGSCVGGGVQLAVACDIRIAGDTTRIGLTPGRYGVVYPVDPTVRLARLVGPARARYLLYTADLITAAEALTFGLVEEVVPVGDLATRAITLGATIASRSPQTLGAVNAVINARAAGRDPNMAIAQWEHWHDDVREGLAAYLEKRPARFADPH